MIVDILDNKHKSLQINYEKKKQSLLNQNDEYKCEISSFKK